MPVHYVHHQFGMWHDNFGLSIDWWDHVFETDQLVDWVTGEKLSQPSGYFPLKWW
ncbi:MAG: hypothetical protein ACLFQP_05530 [Halothece sp.]